MKKIKTKFEDAFLIELKVFEDNRGYFFESFNDQNWNYGSFIQDNEAYSKKEGTLRGLHFQTPPFSQAKLIRVVRGKILDVIVDLRTDSKTFGDFKSFILKEKHALYVPRGFAHGYVTLTNDCIVQYKVDNYYFPKNESGIIYNDETLKIDWLYSKDELILSDKDLKLPSFNEIKNNLWKKHHY